jgi:hypothetical protein
MFFAFLVSLWPKVGSKVGQKISICRQSKANFLSEAPESIITTPPTEIDKRDMRKSRSNGSVERRKHYEGINWDAVRAQKTEGNSFA